MRLRALPLHFDRRTAVGLALALAAGILVFALTRPGETVAVLVAEGPLPVGVPLETLPVGVRRVPDATGLVAGDDAAVLAGWTLSAPLAVGEPLLPSTPGRRADRRPGPLAGARPGRAHLQAKSRIDIYVTVIGGEAAASHLVAVAAPDVAARDRVDLLLAIDDGLAAALVTARNEGELGPGWGDDPAFAHPLSARGTWLSKQQTAGRPAAGRASTGGGSRRKPTPSTSRRRGRDHRGYPASRRVALPRLVLVGIFPCGTARPANAWWPVGPTRGCRMTPPPAEGVGHALLRPAAALAEPSPRRKWVGADPPSAGAPGRSSPGPRLGMPPCVVCSTSISRPRLGRPPRPGSRPPRRCMKLGRCRPERWAGPTPARAHRRCGPLFLHELRRRR